jgi:hypothetical protein
MKEYDHSPSASPAHINVGSFGAVNRFRPKAGGQGGLRVAKSRYKRKNSESETMSTHRFSISESSGRNQQEIAHWDCGVLLEAV